jgi:hypothetical protein
MGMAGIPALMGIDISGSLKMGIPGMGTGTPQNTIYGVYGGLTRKGINAMSAAEREDYLRAVEFPSPAFLENMLKAARMATREPRPRRARLSLTKRESRSGKPRGKRSRRRSAYGPGGSPRRRRRTGNTRISREILRSEKTSFTQRPSWP